MNIDFHVHAALSKQIPFDLDLFLRTVEAARESGLHTLALTDHSDSSNVDRVHGDLDRQFDYAGPHYVAHGIRLLPGIEVAVSEGPHLLVVSDRDTIMAYRRRLDVSADGQGACSTRVFFDLQQGLEMLTILGHPFRNKCQVSRVDPVLYPRFDAVGLNARDLYFHGAELRARTEVFARMVHLPVVAGSDAHHYHQLGSVYNQLHRDFHSIPDLKSLIVDGEYRIRIHPRLGEKVAAARKAKKRLKRTALRRLGLDQPV